MKKVLLSFTLIASVLLAKAQEQLPFFANFENGQGLPDSYTNLPPGNLSILTYQNPLASCAGSQGLVANPTTSDMVFVTPNLTFIGPGSSITVRFNLYAFGSNNLTCGNELNCNATVQVYIVNSSYIETSRLPQGAEIIATGAPTPISTANATTQTATVSSGTIGAIPANTNFRVYLLVNNLGCGNPTRYVIDNLNILDVGQTVTPVSFKAFNASRIKSNVSISWTTASEQNNSGFYVQRNDGNGWKNVAFVFSQATGGNSASDLTYSYTDPNDIKGVSQYRILQVDIDGRSKFSDIRLVKGQEQLGKLIVYPNPSSTGNINVVFDGQGARDVNVTDFSGRLIKKYSSVINNLEIKDLTSGVYSILVTEKATGSKFVQKVVVK